MKRFDPYHIWLGIPPEEQPPSHYRLLGINAFESDRDVIRNAADQRMTYLRTYGGGQHSELSQKLLNEVSAAKVSLVNPDKKAAYDAWLREQLEPSPVDDMAAEPVKSAGEEEEQLDPIVTALERVQPSKPRKKGRPVPRNPRNDLRYLPWILFAVILFAAVLVVAASLWPWPIPWRNSGTVRIVLSDPSADVQVRVDGEVVAVSDLKDPLELEPGEHELSVSGPDYHTERRSFTVEQGQEKRWRVDLVQLVRVGRVKIAISDPSADVDVKVDGDLIEASRLKKPLELAPGQHELSVSGGGYRDHRQSFTVKSGEVKRLHVELVPVAQVNSEDLKSGLHVTYFKGRGVERSQDMLREDVHEEVNWFAAYHPCQGVPFDYFSLRYRGYLRPNTPGAYKLFVTSDDGVRVWIRERLMLDEWKDQWAPTFSTDYIDLLSEPVPIKIEFYEAQGQAELRLYWKRRGESEKEVIPKEALFHRP